MTKWPPIKPIHAPVPKPRRQAKAVTVDDLPLSARTPFCRLQAATLAVIASLKSEQMEVAITRPVSEIFGRDNEQSAADLIDALNAAAPKPTKPKGGK